MRSSPFHGPLFEGYVASEIVKWQLGAGRTAELYYFRDHQGLEVDFVIPTGPGKLLLVEAKASSTAAPAMARSLARLASATTRYKTRQLVVYRPSKALEVFTTLRRDARATGVLGLLKAIETRR